MPDEGKVLCGVFYKPVLTSKNKVRTTLTACNNLLKHQRSCIPIFNLFLKLKIVHCTLQYGTILCFIVHTMPSVTL